MRDVRLGTGDVHVRVDQTGNHIFSRKVANVRVVRHGLTATRIYRRDAFVLDQDGHAALHRRAGAIDQADVRQQQRFRRGGEGRPCEQAQQQRQDAVHGVSPNDPPRINATRVCIATRLAQPHGCISPTPVLKCNFLVAPTPTEAAMDTSTDRIEKQVLLKAPRERVWRALSEADQFGTWFGVRFDGPFVEGERLTGRIAPTQVDEEVAAMQTPYEGTPFEWQVEKIEPMRRIAFRWHPFGVDKRIDYSSEPMTLIVFELHEAPGGILLTVNESGFDKLPQIGRAKAFEANEGGWTHQMRLIEKYLALH